MGIQTAGDAGAYRGKTAIFALWATTLGVENGSPGSVCTIQTNGFDGEASATGSTCHVPLDWKVGERYTMRLKVVASDATTRTWQATAYNTATTQEVIIGRIKTKNSYGLLQGWLSNWTEFYSPGRAECDAPYSRVIFGMPIFDGVYAPVSHQNNLTAGGCPSKITDFRNGVQQEQGNPTVNVLPALPSGGTYISDLSYRGSFTGYGSITKDKSVTNDGKPINLAGKTFAKGIGTHAISEIYYNLNGQYSRFVAYVNLQYGASGNVTYEVWADGAKLFDSGSMDSGSITKAINVDVTGKERLTLKVTDAGDTNNADWAAWADARLLTDTVSSMTPIPTSVPTSAPTVIVIPTSISTTPAPTATPTPTPTAVPAPTLVEGSNKTTTTTRLILARNPSAYGQSVNFVSQVTPTTCKRSVSLFVDGAYDQVKYLTNGGVIFSTATLSRGTHSIQTVYNGTDACLPSNSSTLTQQVN